MLIVPNGGHGMVLERESEEGELYVRFGGFCCFS